MKETIRPPLSSLLRDVPLFAGVSEPTLTALANASYLWRVPQGKTLFSQTDSLGLFSLLTVLAHQRVRRNRPPMR